MEALRSGSKNEPHAYCTGFPDSEIAVRLSRGLGRLLPFLILNFAGGEYTLSGESRCAPYFPRCAIPAHLTDNNLAYRF
jgi:hypothetical protein